MNLGTAQIIRADSRHLPLADNSVDLVVTSPPYFALRSYQDGGKHYEEQIGAEATPAEFVESLLEITRECVRVLKPSGSLWVNLGDKYAQTEERSRNGNGNRKATDNFASGSVLREPTVTLGRKDNGGVRQKSLIGIPWRYALRCIDDLGLILRAEVIWSKPNGLPESVTDRVRRSHEQWFHFTLQPRYFSAVDEIREPHAPASLVRYRTGYTEANNKSGRRDQSGDVDYPDGMIAANPLGKLPGSVWTIPTEPLRVPDHLGIDHFAAFPTEWPKRIIQGWSPAGVCVECGEGRRPVTERTQTARSASAVQHIGHQDPRAKAQGRQTRASIVSTHIITGEECACVPKCVCGHKESDHASTSPRWCLVKGGCDCAEFEHVAAPTTPAVVLDPFGGTGTTAMVAKALGRHGISVDMSADYCRLAEWRTNDRDQLAKVLGIAKAEKPHEDEQSLFDMDGAAS